MHCLQPFAGSAIDFLSDLSDVLLNDTEARRFSDVAAFAFWCRRPHLSRLARDYTSGPRRLGRGMTLHITPANVPVTFAFSFVFGLLAGNPNIVRIPQSDFGQVNVICNAIDKLFAAPAYRLIASMNRLVQYPHDDTITAFLGVRAAARIIWGGDDSVARIRALPASARCVDITFADRYSLSLIQAEAVLDATPASLQTLARHFYNDAFSLQQNACSSPQLLLWMGDEDQTRQAQVRFWTAVQDVVEQQPPMAAAHAVDKLAILCHLAAHLPESSRFEPHGNDIYRVELPILPGNMDRLRGRHGLFFEHRCADLSPLQVIAGPRLQTVTCFGVAEADVADYVVAHGLSGVDRVVPVGTALTIGLIWDGYDLIASLTRIVGTA